MPQRTERIVGYARVSLEDQAEEGYSLEDQDRQIRAYVVAMGWGVVDQIYVDAGVSGATRERPALTRLLADAHAGHVRRIVVTKLDRMSRRAVDLLTIEGELDELDVERSYIKDGIDTSTPTGRLLRTVLAAVAELERDLILERTRDGALQKVRQGVAWLSRAKYGYRYVAGDKRAGVPDRWEIDEPTASVIRRIVSEIAAGAYTAAGLAVQLNREGVPTLRGGRWRAGTISALIADDAYIGVAAYGRRHYIKENGRRKRVFRAQPLLTFAVPPIVDHETMDRARSQLRANFNYARRNTRKPYMLRGLLYCGLCDGAARMHGRDDYVYQCTHHDELNRQRRHLVKRRPLEEAVWGVMCVVLTDVDRAVEGLDAMIGTSQAQVAGASDESARLERSLGDMEARRRRLLDLYEAGDLDRETYRQRVAAIEANRQALLEQQAVLAAARDTALADVINLDNVREACRQLAGSLDEATDGDRQWFAQLLLKRVVATSQQVQIEGRLPELDRTISLLPPSKSGIASGPAWSCRHNSNGVPFTRTVELG